ncbi:3-deoxy-D-manno-octulosonic acid transferase [Paracoccus suum]|uniref:3-deoxy-D-manno-octulosonic acid transferase n=1 Tax=Paracoccus suum TaxID=2259340 RepID=A0A344PJ56_9RHOB|nr:glycosyltransferase N-terminal domain-containing protein [Paracoccus suum]AXC49411.1 3-deoxy-D-manno-octulosonic acid transferase [Paracoccus suum]
MIYRSLTQIAGVGARLLAPVAGENFRARLGLGLPALPAGGIWLHGASVGEIASAATLIAGLRERHEVFVTANTPTGWDTALALGVRAGLAPLDTPQAVAAFLDRLKPRLAITIENELWPNRSAALARRGVPQVVLGARLSQRSAQRWARLDGLIRPMLGRLKAVSVQDYASEARLLALGLPHAALLPRANLKLMAPAQTMPLPPGPERALTVLAASTHAGEEALILDAVTALRARGVPLRLIVAPRHPQRFDEVTALMAARGLPPARRSAGAGPKAPVLLADSMGEMPQWYAAAGICLTGGSLVEKGGHTPWEPAAQSCAILHGPHVANFAGDYATLDGAGAAVPVTTATLADVLGRLLGQPQLQTSLGAKARAILIESAGDPSQLIEMIDTFATG